MIHRTTMTREGNAAEGPVRADAIEQALREVAPDVRRWASRYLGRGYDVDDATQEALIEIAAAATRFEGRSRFRTFAYRVAMRAVARWARRHRRQAVRPPLAAVPDPPEESVDPEARSLSREALERLHEHIAQLPEANRRALLLHVFEGVTHERGAELEATLPRTFRARVTRAKQQLAARLDGDPVLAPFLGELS